MTGNLQFPKQTNIYHGKVRDVYSIGQQHLVMIASNRISAFDVILPHPIPYKGQVLNQIAAKMLAATREICPNWLISTPTGNCSIGKRCHPFKVEMVIRGNLTGHAWRTYSSGQKILCGVPMQEGLRENDYFNEPIITPTTKASAGHDEDISKDEIIKQGIVAEKDYLQIEQYTKQLFEAGKKIAAARGLILVDTKYEFGKIGDSIVLMDEIHTPDSSRYFYADGFEERLSRNEKQMQLSKEFVREWLIANNFMGKEGQTVPHMSEDWIQTISQRYITLYEKVTGETFVPDTSSADLQYQRICQALSLLDS
jgi:phosphoribosylaminoimidazole-succinocarboxamide synthase